MKQTIEEAEKEYCDKNYPYSDLNIRLLVENAFEAGAEWYAKQSIWVSVEDRLPEPDKEVLLYDKNSIRHYVIGWLRRHKGYNKGMWALSNGWVEDKDITHWRPIPSFDETLKANKDDFLSHHIDKVKMEIIRIVANDAQAVAFQTLGQYRSWLMKTINELSYPNT